MKRASIIKFSKENKFVLYPINTLVGGGGKASSPFVVEENVGYDKVAESLLEVLEKSIVDAPRPLDNKAWQKHYLKSIGVKSLKELHDGKLNVGVFVKDGNYYISPTNNKGPKQGFQGSVENRIIVPTSLELHELANVLETAFEKSN